MHSFALPRTRQGSTENSPVLDMVKAPETHGGQCPIAATANCHKFSGLKLHPLFCHGLEVRHPALVSGAKVGLVAFSSSHTPRRGLPPPSAHTATLPLSGPSSVTTSFSLAEARQVLCFQGSCG